MSNIYKVNLTWTSPLIEYAPSGAWTSAISGQNDSTASFSFYGTLTIQTPASLAGSHCPTDIEYHSKGNGIKWFGAANASTYAIQLDGQLISAQPRKYPRIAEGPTDLYCNESIPWDCMVLAEFYNLSASVEHTVELTTGFGRNATGDKVNLLAVQTLYDTQSTSVVQSNDVQMDDTRLVYAGDWANITYDPLVYRVSKTPGSTISFQFEGYSIELWGTTDITQSPFTVSLDGHSQNVSLPSSGSTDPNCLFWYSAGLDETVEHTVVVTNTATSGLVIAGFSFEQLIGPDGPGENQDTGQTSSQNLHPGAIAGIIIALIFVLGVSTFLYMRIKRRRLDQVVTLHDSGNAGSTTSTILSLRPLLGGNRSRSRTQIFPWSETPDSRVDLRGPSSPDQPSPITSTPPTRAKQALLGIPASASHPPHMPSPERRGSTQPQNELSSSRRPSAPRIQDGATGNSSTTAAAPAIWTATAQHKPPLHPQSNEAQPTSLPTSSLSTITAGDTGSIQVQPTTLDLQHSEDHGSLSHHNHTNVAEPSGGGVERSATPPPAYEAQAESSREGERRALRRGISKAIEERFRVVQND